MILYYYLPQTKLREGNDCTPVCHSVHGGGVGLPNKEPPGQRPYFLTETPISTDPPHFTVMSGRLVVIYYQ